MPSDPTPRTAATARALRERLENHVAEATETGVWDLAGWTATLDDLIALAAAEARPNATAATARERVKAMQRALLMSPRVRDGVWLRDSGHQYRAAEEVLAEFDQALAIPASPAGVAALTPGDFAKALHVAHRVLGYWPDPDVIDGRWEMWGVVLHSLLAIPEAPGRVAALESDSERLAQALNIVAITLHNMDGGRLTGEYMSASSVARHALREHAALAAAASPAGVSALDVDVLVKAARDSGWGDLGEEVARDIHAALPAPAPTPSEPVERCRACGHEAARHRPDTCASCDGLDGPHTGICTGYQPTPATRDE